MACDFFTVEAVWLRTVYVLFFIELGIHRVFFAGCTANPVGKWVTQQARQLVWKLEEVPTETKPHRFLIHERDRNLTSARARIRGSTSRYLTRLIGPEVRGT